MRYRPVAAFACITGRSALPAVFVCQLFLPAVFVCQLCLAVILAALDDLRHIGLVAG